MLNDKALHSVCLDTANAAALIERSPHTLVRARHDRADLRMPPCVSLPGRRVRYPLAGLLEWSRRRGEPLHWHALAVSVALPTRDALVEAGLDVPQGLSALLARLRRV